MLGIDVGLPTVIAFSPLIGVLGQVLFKATIAVGLLVIISHILTRLLKLFF